jgi:iron complex transport system substrate-binding protein
MKQKLVAALLAALACVVVAAGPSNAATPVRLASAKHPTRIVSLSPTATEMLFAVGAGKQVLAVDDQSNYPAKAPRTKLSGYRPNVEAIAGYRPDLVVMADGSIADQLGKLGIATLVLPAAKKLTDSYRELRQLGDATGHGATARTVAARMQGDIEAAASEVKKRSTQPSAYWELDDTFFSADSSTFIGQLLKTAGLRNIADKAGGSNSGYPQLSAEYIVQSNPSVIFLADTKCCRQSEASVASRPGFAQLLAVRDHHVIPLDDDIASRWGPRVVDLVRQIVNATKQW